MACGEGGLKVCAPCAEDRSAAERDHRALVVLLTRAEKERDLATVRAAAIEVELELTKECELAGTGALCGKCITCLTFALEASRLANVVLQEERQQLTLELSKMQELYTVERY